jgi:diguanylate cyclase (GGDEF)-like protein/PAS domain S-box-containing protein
MSESINKQEHPMKNEIKSQTLFELLPYGVFMVDMVSGLISEFNAVAHNQIGYSAHEFSTMRIADFEAIEDEEAHQAHLKRIRDNGHDLFETKFRCKDGTLIDIEVNVVYLVISDHPYLMAVCRDITQKNEAERLEHQRQKAFEEQAIFLRTLVDTIPDLIWLKDVNGVYLACNPMFERFFGAKEAEIVGKTDFDFVDEELAEFFRDHDNVAMESGGARISEEFLVFADGSYEGLFDTIKTPMKDMHGNVIGVLGIARDVSERKKKEEEIQHVQELSHVGAWEWDIVNNEFVGSDEAYRIFSIPLGQKVSMEALQSHVFTEDKELFERETMKVLSGESTEISYRIVDENGHVKWIESTATTFFDKDNHPYKASGLARDVTVRKLHEQKLEALANNDVLTGLANRPFLLAHLRNTLEKAARDNRMIALLMFDLDRFKDVNDSFGHKAGDELLVHVAQRFRERMREGDLIARLGGDEFVVVLDNLVHTEDAGRIAEEMIRALGVEYELGDGVSVHVGASVGIVISPNHGNVAEELLQFADAALYRAKDSGRGTFCYYTDDLTESARKRVEWETQLRRAIQKEEFEVYYQPQVHMATGHIVGAEALVRWNDPVRGIIAPAMFIPLAEETGLIGAIGEWVLNETCRQGKIWMDAGYRLTLAVNVSAHQMRHQDIPAMVDNALKKSGYKAEHLELELTESVLMERGCTMYQGYFKSQPVPAAEFEKLLN